MSRIVEISTEKSNRENSWLEVGQMKNGKWIAAPARYPQNEKAIKVSREYWNAANGDGKSNGTAWTIEIPDGSSLQIAKISMHRSGKQVRVL